MKSWGLIFGYLVLTFACGWFAHSALTESTEVTYVWLGILGPGVSLFPLFAAPSGSFSLSLLAVYIVNSAMILIPAFIGMTTKNLLWFVLSGAIWCISGILMFEAFMGI